MSQAYRCESFERPTFEIEEGQSRAHTNLQLRNSSAEKKTFLENKTPLPVSFFRRLDDSPEILLELEA